MKISIIGAGMAGLLAGKMLQQRGHIVTIYEKQPALPNNHSAVLRFRSNIVSDVTGIPFKRVTMIKSSVPSKNPVADSLMYSFKAFGKYRSDRSITMDFSSNERFIAPPDFISRLSEGLNIQFNWDANLLLDSLAKLSIPIISTIPMPMLVSLLKYPQAESLQFNSTDGFTLRCVIKDCDAYASLYVPDLDFPFYRVSITGNEFICEMSNHTLNSLGSINSLGHMFDIVATGLILLGIDPDQIDHDKTESDYSCSSQRYAKIDPINDNERKRFMSWATDNFNIYSLGRFATWRPGLLLDDLVKDIRLIEGWASNNDGGYDVRKAR